MKSVKGNIYISHAWGGDSETVVKRIMRRFQQEGMDIMLDKKDLGYRESIDHFMKNLGKADAVIIVVSNKYLHSEFCMYELLQIYENKDILQRIFPVVLDEVDISKPAKRLELIKYWEDQANDLEAGIRDLQSISHVEGITDELNLYHNIRGKIAKLTHILKDINVLNISLHTERDFQDLVDSIQTRLKEVGKRDHKIEPGTEGVNIAPRFANRITKDERIKSKVPFFQKVVIKVLASVLAFSIIGFAIYYTKSQNKSRDTDFNKEMTIAVLPFINLNEEEEEKNYFSDGITDDLITHLSRVKALNVISRMSVMPFKNSTKGIREISAELGARAILTGSIRWMGDRVRINAQLVNAETDTQLWGESYDRDEKDIFLIQSEVALQIAKALKTALSEKEEEQLKNKPEYNFEAYQFYIKGRDHYYRYTFDDNEKAIYFYNQSIEIDPELAPAWAGLANAYNQRRTKYWFDVQVLDTSYYFSQKAIELDPYLADGYTALGQIYEILYDYGPAIENYEKAIDLNPNYGPAIFQLSKINYDLGKLDVAYGYARKALVLDPNIVYRSIILAWIYQRLSCHAAAKKWINRALSLDPDNPFAQSVLIEEYLYTGETKKARTQYKKTNSQHPEWFMGFFMGGLIEICDRNYDDALQLLDTMYNINQSNKEYFYGYTLLKTGDVSNGYVIIDYEIKEYKEYIEQYENVIGANEFELANMFAIKNNRDEALNWLRKAISKGWIDYQRVERFPYMDELKKDPEFKNMIENVILKVETMKLKLSSEFTDFGCM